MARTLTICTYADLNDEAKANARATLMADEKSFAALAVAAQTEEIRADIREHVTAPLAAMGVLKNADSYTINRDAETWAGILDGLHLAPEMGAHGVLKIQIQSILNACETAHEWCKAHPRPTKAGAEGKLEKNLELTACLITKALEMYEGGLVATAAEAMDEDAFAAMCEAHGAEFLENGRVWHYEAEPKPQPKGKAAKAA